MFRQRNNAKWRQKFPTATKTKFSKILKSEVVFCTLIRIHNSFCGCYQQPTPEKNSRVKYSFQNWKKFISSNSLRWIPLWRRLMITAAKRVLNPNQSAKHNFRFQTFRKFCFCCYWKFLTSFCLISLLEQPKLCFFR